MYEWERTITNLRVEVERLRKIEVAAREVLADYEKDIIPRMETMKNLRAVLREKENKEEK